MKANDLRKKSVGDLQEELLASLKEQFNLRIQKSLGQNTKTHIFKNVRRKIARLLTLIHEKEGSSA